MDYHLSRNYKRKDFPKSKANIFSRILFIYILPTFKNGFRKDLTENDLCKVPDEFSSRKLGDHLEKEWNKQKGDGNLSLINLLLRTYGIKYFCYGFLQLIVSLIVLIVQPIVIARFVAYFIRNQDEFTINDAYHYGSIIIGLNVLTTIFNNNYYLKLNEIGIQARTAVCSLIYRKSLKLHSNNVNKVLIGNVITLTTKDVQTFGNFVETANDCWIGIIRTFVAMYLIYTALGIIAFIPVGVFLFFMPLQVYLGKCTTKLRIKVSKHTDERLQVMKETLSAIRIIKMYVWEKFFLQKIADRRRKEIETTFHLFLTRLAIMLIGLTTRLLCFYAMIITYFLNGNTVSANLFVFVIRCYQHLAHTLSDLFPNGITQISEFYATIIRIETYLNQDEQYVDRTMNRTLTPEIHLENVSIKTNNNNMEILKNINLNLKVGLNIITGPVGSGKTTLLKAIINDIEITSGNLRIIGRISYAPQTLWLFPSTIKQNILFGQKFNEKRYRQVIDICSLMYDLENLPYGDETIIEDNGVNLSIGQQARINLARAIYKDADIYILDDCLSALDPEVSNYIFTQCIQRFLKKKLIVLVNHNYIHLADNLIILNHGEIVSMKYTENIKNYINNNNNNNNNDENDNNDKDIDKDKISEYSSIEKIISANGGDDDDKSIELVELISDNKQRQIYAETQKFGGVDRSVYKKYIQLGGGYCIFIAIILTFAFTQFIDTALDKVVTVWINNEEVLANFTKYNDTSTEYEVTVSIRKTLLIINVIFVFLSVFCALTRTTILLMFTKKVAINLHKIMLLPIINTPVSFFDQNFIGNILNRFSKDLVTVDEYAPFVLLYIIIAFLLLLGAIILIATVNAMFLIPTFIFFAILTLIRYCYQPTARSLKRLDAKTRSPVIGYLNSTLEGLAVIKTSNIDKILIGEFDRHHDLYTSANYTLCISIRSFTFWLDSLCTLFISIVVSKFLLFEDDTLAGNVGLALTQAFMLTDKLEFGIRQWAELENVMTSVERTLEYANIKTESQKGCVMADNWPKSGEIIYENVSLYYTNCTEPILKKLNFTIKSGEKIGIVGRTGAGKSSLLSTLFRLYDIDGRILIDNVDIRTLSLHFLRSNIAIIPQSPILFNGTIRDNLDPERNYNDDEIWRAINSVHIKHLINNLDTNIGEFSDYFSTGQRQLICIARAILRRSKIVVLDEATANMDLITDSLIQETIKNNFQSCTVLIIAHRLCTILDCDRIMVFNKGEIIEFDTPDRLIKNETGIFANMLNKNQKLLTN